MKKIFIIAILIALSGQLFAQLPNRGRATQAPLPPPLPTREVSGVVKDASGQTVIGAAVTLKSKSDSLVVATNDDGIFIFKNVKLATFLIEVKSLGYVPYLKKYLNSDIAKRVVLDPVELKTKDNVLNEVKIDGTPSITYKTDTVEYKASDYKVRPNSTVDEVLKKMEGMEVGTDGSLTHQGQAVVRAKLNGKEYSGGSVAQAIQNLPADIVDKIQIVDDYGDQAARTGVKDGDPQKILNITTKADKSVGTTGRLTTQYGSNDRYNGQLFLQRINANQQLGVIGNLRNTVTGVATDGSGGGATGGTSRTGSPSFNYRDQWGKKVQVVSSYAYKFNDNTSLNNSFGERYTNRGQSNFVEQSTRENNSTGHNVNLEVEYNPDSANYIKVTPTFGYTNSSNATNSLADNINNYTTGFEHRVDKNIISNLNTSSNYGLNALYLHIFKKPKRNVSLQLNVTHSNTVADGDRNTRTRNFADSTQDVLLKDSLSHILTNRTSNNTTYQATVTYVEPLGGSSLLQFAGEMRHSVNDLQALSDSVLANGDVQRLYRLDNIYNYSLTETRASLNYRFNGSKYNFSLGVTLSPFVLNGTKVDNNTGLDASTSRSYMRIIPVFRFSYIWSRTERLQINYSGRYAEPNFQQLQPFTDRSDPNNIIVGNPDLRPTFTNTIAANYNNYLANSKISIGLNLNATIFNDQVSTNTLFIPVQISPAIPATPTSPAVDAKYRTVNENHYINIDGSHTISGGHSISKSFSDRRYSLALNGNISYSYGAAMSNDVLYHTTNWVFDERFGPRINPTEWFEINPAVQYKVSRTFSTSTDARSTELKTMALRVDGKVYFMKTFQFNYSAAKSQVTGLGSLNTSPLVINAGFEKEFFPKRSLVLTFNVFDLLHQNNFVQQTVTAQGITNTLSNNLSRYFLVGLRLNLQKWSGRPQRNGINMQRRGDGSFIY